MKNLIFVNGTMGVGKTETGKQLKKVLPGCVFLDGDWCWDADPFVVTEETKKMVEQNIACLLQNFLRCSAYENVVFCWVMHRQDIIESILSRLDTGGYRLYVYTLTCSEQALASRIAKDVKQGLRSSENAGESIRRLALYDGIDSFKIDTTGLSPKQAADIIFVKLYPEGGVGR